MANTNNQPQDIILDIQVRYTDALENIAKYMRIVQDVRKANDDLKKQLQANTITQEQYNLAVAANNEIIEQANQRLRLYRRELQNNLRQEREEEGSINSLQAKIANLNREYEALGRARRNAAEGDTLLAQINELQDELNAANEARQRFQHNVGNYTNSILEAAARGNFFAESLLRINQNSNGASGALNNMTRQAKSFFKVMVANPVLAVLAALVGMLLAVKKAISSSEEASQRWNRILAPLSLLIDSMLNLLQKFVGVITSGIEAVLDMAMALSRLMEKLPLVGKLFKEVNDAVEESVELQEKKNKLDLLERETMVQNAKNARDIAELRTKSEQKELYAAEQRLDFIRQANKLEEQSAVMAKKIAKDRLENAEKEASKTENTKEKEIELSNLRADLFRADTDLYNKQRELIAKETALISEIKSEETKQLEDRKKAGEQFAARQKELRDKEIEAIRQYEDSVTALITNEAERQRRTLELNYKRQVEDLKNKLATEKNLNDTARKNINSTIQNYEKQLNVELEKLRAENLNREAERKQKEIQLRLSVLKEESAEALKLRISLLESQRAAELAEAEKTGIDRALVNAKYDVLIGDESIKAQKYANDKLLEEQRLAWENRITAARINGENTLQLEIDQRTEQLAALQQLEGESDAQYLARKLELQEQVKEKTKEAADYQMEQNTMIVESFEALFGSFSEFLQEFAEDSEALAAFSKALALFEIGLNTAKALSAGIAAAQSVPFPGNLAAIATTTATILANIAKAKSILQSQKEAKAPQFASGGLVRGPGSGTSDSITARLSNGESVMTARTTSMFAPILSAFNQIGGGVPIPSQQTSSQLMGEEMLTRAFKAAIVDLPNPVVSVTDIKRENNKVGSVTVIRTS